MIATFMFCDVTQYELSARGEMTGDDVLPLVAAIDMLPDDSVAVVDLRDITEIDVPAASALRDAIAARIVYGVEFVIAVDCPHTYAVLCAGGLGHLVTSKVLSQAS